MKKIRLNNTNEVIYYEKLDNGLDVYMCPKDNCESFYLTYNIKFGSMDTLVKVANEKKKVSFPQGTAHFLEHQLFQNENNKTAFEDFANLGSTVNAYTSYKLTCYEVMGSTKFKENLECLYKLVNTPIFQDKSIENEKKIITNEINMYDASPLAMLTFGLEYNLNIYDKHKYSISGTVSDIDKITSKILYKAYDTFYSKENSFMVIVGNFSHLEALGILKEIIKKYKNIIYKKYTIISRKEPLKVENKSTVKIMSVDKPKVNIAFKIDKRSLNKYSNLKIYLDMLLDIKFSNSSDFYEIVSLNHIIDD